MGKKPQLNGLPIFLLKLDVNISVFSSSLPSTKSKMLSEVPNLIFVPADKMILNPVLAGNKSSFPLCREIICFLFLVFPPHRDEPIQSAVHHTTAYKKLDPPDTLLTQE